MATVDCITPVKSRLHRAAGSHYLPQTPSPRTRHQQLSTPDRVPSLHASPKFAEILRKSVHKSTPKSNIASANTPRRLELGLSDWTLTGTGPNTPPKSSTAAHATSPPSASPTTPLTASSLTARPLRPSAMSVLAASSSRTGQSPAPALRARPFFLGPLAPLTLADVAPKTTQLSR